MSEFNTNKLPNETEEAYIWRLGQAKDSGVLNVDWNVIAGLINKNFRKDETEYRTEAAYRKPYQMSKRFYEAGVFSNPQDDNYIEKLREAKQDVQKEKRKLSDERLDLNKKLRETARYEVTLEKLEEMLSSIGKERYVGSATRTMPLGNGTTGMVVMLSDLHIGASYHSTYGDYDSEIAKERLNEYLEEILDIQSRHKASTCYVTLLGDLISGNIHSTISITNKEDVIEQVKLATLYIADFVNELSKHFPKVVVHGVAGNHSRIEKNKEDALISERLDMLIPWFIKIMLKDLQNVIIIDEEKDCTLSEFNYLGKTYVAVHGDYENFTESSIAKLALWTNNKPYCVLTGHKHYPASTEVSGIKVIQSGCLGGGGDDYTRQKRLVGKPSQTVLVLDYTGIKAIYPVHLGKYA